MVMADVGMGSMPVRELVVVDRVRPTMPDHEDVFWIP